MTRFVLLLSAGAMLAAVPAAAQQPPPRPERPYRGLFGGGVGNAEQLLTLDVSLGGGYDDNVLANGPATGGVADPRLAQSGNFGSVSGQLAYSLNRNRVGVNATLATSNYYYPSLDDSFAGAHTGSVGALFRAGKSTVISLAHATSYQPYLTLGLFPQLFEVPGSVLPPRPEFAADQSDYFDHLSAVSFSHGLSRRAGLVLHYARQFSDFDDENRDYASHSAGGRLTWGLARGLSVYGGYGLTDALYASAIDRSNRVRGHTIDAGVDFNRALSFSRRTTLSFGTGSAAIVDQERTHYRITGRARLNHEIARTWNASLAYVRDAGFIEALREPVFSDSVTLAFGGMISRRLQFHSNASASIGEFVLTGGSGFDTYSGTVGLTYGLSRHFGVGTGYTYYHYAFERGAPLRLSMPRQLGRQSVQAFITAWTPLIHRARRPDAAR